MPKALVETDGCNAHAAAGIGRLNSEERRSRGSKGWLAPGSLARAGTRGGWLQSASATGVVSHAPTSHFGM